MGLACSAGQFLLSAGTPGKRRALPHSRILMHQGSAGIGGSTVEVEVQADDLRHTRDTVLGLIAEDTGQAPERIMDVYSQLLTERIVYLGTSIDAGAVLLAGGAPGLRSMLPHARVVLHQPAGSGRGTIPDLILQADELVRIRAETERLLSLHTGRTVRALRADTDRERVLTASEALDYGIVDEVLDRRPAAPAGSR
ncbi:ATP-dependent Clp protease proteolytic subunit [Zafaria sp. J156]|uniref:ATP-dependent Clp protease proteolytic subunit n=1 Tax=Zafaria sp. J156 TaxID=3116490 RepID=UPI003D3690B9